MLQAAREMQPPSPACLGEGGRHMQAGGRSPIEHLSPSALLLQKRGGWLGASGGGQRGKAGCNVCSVQSQQLFVVESLQLTHGSQW